MPNPTQTSLRNGAATVTATTLDSSDAFVFQAHAKQVMILHNPTAAPISPILKSFDAPEQFHAKTIGYLNLRDGLPLGAIAAGARVAIPLDQHYEWLNGTKTFIMNGAGLVCEIFTRDTVPAFPDLLWIDLGALAAEGTLTASSKLWSL